MTVEKVNALMLEILDDTPLLKNDGVGAVKELAYIAGAYDFAMKVKKAIEGEGK